MIDLLFVYFHKELEMSVDFGMMARMIVDAFENKKEPFADQKQKRKRMRVTPFMAVCVLSVIGCYAYYQSRTKR